MRATVTTPNGERFESVTGPLLDYYLAEAEVKPGYRIAEDEADAAATFPQVWEDGERVDQPAEVQPLDGSTNTVTTGDDGVPVLNEGDPDNGDDEDHPRPSPNPAA